MDQAVRNKLRNVVTQCRKALEDATAKALQGRFGIYAGRKKGEVQIEEESRMGHLAQEDRACRKDLIEHLSHIQAIGYKPREALDQLVREIAFTHLNRLCAYKMMEARGLIREAVSRGVKSQGFLFYLADHPEDEKLHKSGQQDEAYRHYLDWLGGTLSEEIGVLFNPNDPANRIYPPQRVLDQVLALINIDDLNGIWTEDETIGWVYQYFTPKELRDKARKESQAPRNSYELAFRNQFFTPRYVVEFLTDNTLGRIWYEMRKGETTLKDRCRYMVRRPTEIFLKEGEDTPPAAKGAQEELSQEELLKLPVHIPHRAKKDPREIRVLDPACGSGHFLLYCFDLLQVIYEEAYADPELGSALKKDYPSLDELRRGVPSLVLKHNLHGIDIDLRATQIAALALWLRCQRTYQDLGLPNGERPKITRSNIVCAEPMPGEADLLKEFTATLQPKVLGQLVEVVFEKMKFAGEAGSLLRIEEEIQEAVAAAKQEYQSEMKRLRDEAGYLPGMAPPREATLFDFADMTDEAFLDRAEEEIVEALRQYAEQKANGKAFRRRLFAEDAARGFAFVEVCHRRYNVVLMNPPFGSPSLIGKPYTDMRYPVSREDVDASFVLRGFELTGRSGKVGAITNRTILLKATLEDWRKTVCLGVGGLGVLADLGLGVLDTALVEAAAYTVQPSAESPTDPSLFAVRLMRSNNKSGDLERAIQTLTGTGVTECFWARRDVLARFPAARLAYFATRQQQRWFDSLPPMNGHNLLIRQGLITGDNFRFVRLQWEVPPTMASVKWFFFDKGGEYSPYFGDLHLVVNWENDGHEIRNFCGPSGKLASRPQNTDFYFRAGITYPRRTGSNASFRLFPEGAIFDAQAPLITQDMPDHDFVLSVAGVLNSRPVASMLELLIASADSVASASAARTYEVGILDALPLPVMSLDSCQRVARSVRSVWRRQVGRHLLHEEWDPREAGFPFLLRKRHQSIRALAVALLEGDEDLIQGSLGDTADIAEIIDDLFGTESVTAAQIEEEFGIHPSRFERSQIDQERFAELYGLPLEQLVDVVAEEETASRVVTKKSFLVDRRTELLCLYFRCHPEDVLDLRRKLGLSPPGHSETTSARVVSFAVGCGFGHWDVCHAPIGDEKGQVSDPFAALPVCPRGILQGPEGLPAKPEDVPADYPLRIDWDGILVDDPEHEDDIVRRVRDVLEVIWEDRAEAMEKEACEALGVKGLHDYFRKPGNGGFWTDHVKRYSKSRRKAPIYWYLRSAKGNYGLWLYYHRLDKDILFKALLNYVEPKIRLEEDRLNTMRARKEAAGTSGREAKRIEKEMDRQEQLVSELHDFKDKLRRAADLHLTPDLNDGVVLNIAPLWELVPWKEAQKYWEELQEGKYDWAHIALELWPERVKEKCRTDRSIAIAHRLEELWEGDTREAVTRNRATR